MRWSQSYYELQTHHCAPSVVHTLSYRLDQMNRHEFFLSKIRHLHKQELLVDTVCYPVQLSWFALHHLHHFLGHRVEADCIHSSR